MQRQIRLLKIIGKSSGASMVFVLAVMLLLIAIGVSTLAAASVNSGAGINRQIVNQLNMYSDSIQKSIMYSLQSSSDDETIYIAAGPTTLGGQIFAAAYKKNENGGLDENGGFTLTLIPFISDTALSAVPEITVSIMPAQITPTEFMPLVDITPCEDEQKEVRTLDEGIVISPYVPRQPQTAVIRGTATVTFTTEYMEKSITTVAIYNIDGLLQDDGDGVEIENMTIADAGKWELISHEKIEKKVEDDTSE